jgi:hypothetical protein
MKNPRLADKTIVFSEHEVSKVVVMVTRQFFKNILTNEKSPKNITFIAKLLISQHIYVRYVIIRNISLNLR